MKKYLFFIALLGIMANTNAQDRFAFGIKAGFNSTKLKLTNIPSGSELKNEANNGFLVGAYGNIRLLGGLSLQPELYYAKKSSKLSYIDEDDSNSATTNTFYSWDIPILAKLQILDLSIVKVYGIAGPVASFLAKTQTDLPQWDQFKNTNWTFQAGGGVELGRLSADVRYEWGLSDISDLKEFNLGQKTDVLTFAIGYRLTGNK